ncbi:Uncharacterised protein [Escherichia coli]|nr:Uncharacterised protein [Escherichia coli]
MRRKECRAQIAQREKYQCANDNNFNDIADGHHDERSTASSNSRMGSGIRRQWRPSCSALMTGLELCVKGSGHAPLFWGKQAHLHQLGTDLIIFKPDHTV